MGYWLFWREWEYMMPEILDWVRTANLGESLKVLTWRKCAQRSAAQEEWDGYQRVEGLQCCQTRLLWRS